MQNQNESAAGAPQEPVNAKSVAAFALVFSNTDSDQLHTNLGISDERNQQLFDHMKAAMKRLDDAEEPESILPTLNALLAEAANFNEAGYILFSFANNMGRRQNSGPAGLLAALLGGR